MPCERGPRSFGAQCMSRRAVRSGRRGWDVVYRDNLLMLCPELRNTTSQHPIAAAAPSKCWGRARLHLMVRRQVIFRNEDGLCQYANISLLASSLEVIGFRDRRACLRGFELDLAQSRRYPPSYCLPVSDHFPGGSRLSLGQHRTRDESRGTLCQNSGGERQPPIAIEKTPHHLHFT